jgi:hypothetical protein
MRKANQILVVLAAVLLLASILLYRSSARQADRFERGQRLLPQLDVDQIGSVTITKAEESLTLNRSGEQFVVEEAHDYPARNEAVNRLFKDILDLELEQEIGSGEDSALLEELGLVEGGEESTVVALRDGSGDEMVRFRTGKNAEEGSGRYIQRLDEEAQTVYVTTARFDPQTSPSSYLDTEIVDVAKSQISRIEGPDFVFSVPEGGSLSLEDIPAGKKEKTIDVNKVTGVLTRLTFDEVFLADDEAVQGLTFRPALRIELDDSTGYVLESAEQGEDRFLRISGFHTVDRVEITRDESEEELKEKADLLTRVDEVKAFNDFHGSWVYQVPSHIAAKMDLTKADLMESENS